MAASCAPGTLFTGASLIPRNCTCVVATALRAPPEPWSPKFPSLNSQRKSTSPAGFWLLLV